MFVYLQLEKKMGTNFTSDDPIGAKHQVGFRRGGSMGGKRPFVIFCEGLKGLEGSIQCICILECQTVRAKVSTIESWLVELCSMVFVLLWAR